MLHIKTTINYFDITKILDNKFMALSLCNNGMRQLLTNNRLNKDSYQKTVSNILRTFLTILTVSILTSNAIFAKLF